MGTPAARRHRSKTVLPFDAEGELEKGPWPLLEPGMYRVQLLDWQTHMLFGRSPRCFTWWETETLHEGERLRLLRSYRVLKLHGKPRRRGGFRCAYNGSLWREYTSLVGAAAGRRPDRVAWSRLFPCIVEAEVETVERGSRQEVLAEGAQYSVIRRLISIGAGTPR